MKLFEKKMRDGLTEWPEKLEYFLELIPQKVQFSQVNPGTVCSSCLMSVHLNFKDLKIFRKYLPKVFSKYLEKLIGNRSFITTTTNILVQTLSAIFISSCQPSRRLYQEGPRLEDGDSKNLNISTLQAITGIWVAWDKINFLSGSDRENLKHQLVDWSCLFKPGPQLSAYQFRSYFMLRDCLIARVDSNKQITNSRSLYSPSLLMPAAMHFLSLQYWHLLRFILWMVHCWFLVQGL